MDYIYIYRYIKHMSCCKPSSFRLFRSCFCAVSPSLCRAGSQLPAMPRHSPAHGTHQSFLTTVVHGVFEGILAVWKRSSAFHRCHDRSNTGQRLVFYTSDLKLHDQILAGGVAISGHQWPFPTTRGVLVASHNILLDAKLPGSLAASSCSWRLDDHTMGDLEMIWNVPSSVSWLSRA